MKNKIPIVLAADNNYRYPLMVTLLSAVMNAEANTQYQFIILVPNEFEADSVKIINRLLKENNMPEAIFYNMQKDYQGIQMQIKHITYATFYRLQLPELLKDIDKCIYLDVDTVIEKDLKDLFDIEIENKYMAGVKAAGYYYPEEKKVKSMQLLEIAEFDQYVNAGVLLLNLKKMREDNLSESFENLLKKNFPSQDQDILNAACYSQIKILPPKYNAMTKYDAGNKKAYDTIECLSICYSREEWNEACDSPVIIHYADRWKPWQDLRGSFVEEWWKYAMLLEKETDYFRWLVENIAHYQKEISSNLQNKLQKAYKEKSEINAKLQKTYEEKSEINAKLQKAYKEKSEINAKLQKTYKEKSEINAKLKKAYEEKSEINAKLHKTYEEKSEINAKLKKTHGEKSSHEEKIKKLRERLKDTKAELEQKSKRLEQLEKEKKQLEGHFLGRFVLEKYNK